VLSFELKDLATKSFDADFADLRCFVSQLFNKIVDMADYKLSREQFADAVSKGLGRAMIHVKQHGLDDIADILLDACVHNKIYDAQCEDRRTDWLYAMFNNSPQYNDFRDGILSALKKESVWREITLICDLAKEMALDGDKYAQAALKDFVLKSAAVQGETDYFGIDEYIKADGNNAVLELAKIYGQRLIDNPEDEVVDRLSYNDEKCKAFSQLLKDHSYSDHRIKIYFDYLDDNDGLDPYVVPSEADLENRKIEFLSQYNVERIIDCAKEGREENKSIYRRFGRYAEPNDLEVIFAELLKAKEDGVRKRLLWVFWAIPLPAIHECFFEWADSEDEELRASILSAFANFKNDKVHEFARKRVREGKIMGWGNHFVLDIFEKNFENDDANLISDAILTSKPAKDDIHRFGLSIADIAKENKTSELKDMLIWVYENTPCSNCRERAAKGLNEIGALSQEMIDECLWDGSEEIRKFAKGLMKQKPME